MSASLSARKEFKAQGESSLQMEKNVCEWAEFFKFTVH